MPNTDKNTQVPQCDKNAVMVSYYTEKEVAELLRVQRGNCYVAILSDTRNTKLAELTVLAPEPAGGKWRR